VYKKILVAVDFSAHSGEALLRAIVLAKTCGAEIHLVHAFDLPVPLVSPHEIAVPSELFDQAWQSATNMLGEEADKVSGAGVQATPHLLEVPAASAIADLAKEIGAALVVMGASGHGALRHLALGSVTERTLRLSPCSVLVVKPGDTPN